MSKSGVPAAWKPRRFLRFHRAIASSTGVALIRTDAGDAFLKAMGNREGPHALAREYIGMQVAALLGIATPQFAILEVRPEDDILLGHERKAKPGPAFVSRKLDGFEWGGDIKSIKKLTGRPRAITSLVALDTLLLNRDRYPPEGDDRAANYGNVFLSTEGAPAGQIRLIALDFTHCLCPESDLSPKMAQIDRCRDERVYGLFPEFSRFVKRADLEVFLSDMQKLTKEACMTIVRAVPQEWEVADTAREGIAAFLAERAGFLTDHLPSALTNRLGRTGSLWGGS